MPPEPHPTLPLTPALADTPLLLIAPLADETTADAVAAALEDEAAALLTGRSGSDGRSEGGAWYVQVILEDLPPPARDARLGRIVARLAVLESVLGRPLPAPAADTLPARDWVAHVLAEMVPNVTRHFWIRGSHIRQPPPANRRGLVIDAASAFGTGEHPTTRGAILMLEQLVARRRLGPIRPPRAALDPRRRPAILDMGCGTGVLAMAGALMLGWPALGIDIDRASVASASAFATRNRLAHRVHIAHGNGFHAAGVAGMRARWPLIFANILARPLITMAPQLSRALTPGGIAILAGLLHRQERAVRAAYRLQHMVPLARLHLAGWSILAMQRVR